MYRYLVRLVLGVSKILLTITYIFDGRSEEAKNLVGEPVRKEY